MKKIKKGLCALSLAICGGTAFTVPMFSGCGGPAQQGTDGDGYEFVSIEGGTNNYYENDVFSLEGKNMTIKDKKTNQNIVIPLTNDMIIGGLGSIDMTTGGEKEITVVYDGKEYSFVITVNEKTQASFFEQLAALLRKYQSDSIKSVDFSMSLGYDARFLNQTSQEQADSPIVTVNKEDINQIEGTELFKTYVKELFEAITNSFVTSSLSSSQEGITNAGENRVSVSWTSFASNLLLQASTKQNISYAMNTTFSAKDAVEKIVELAKDGSKEFLLNAIFATDSVIYDVLMRNTQSIENFERDVYDGLKDYFDVLASGSTQSLAEFVDNQTNSELYEQNLEQYGTPYFLYEQRKAYLNALIETIAEEQNVSFDSLRPYIDVLIDFYKNIDEFAIYEGDFGDYVYEAMQDFAADLYAVKREIDADTMNYMKYNIVAASELLNVIFNKEYADDAEFLSLVLKEDALGDICYDVLPTVCVSYLNSAFADDENYIDVSEAEIKAVVKTTLDRIKNQKTFENFSLFTDFANLMIGTELTDGKFVEMDADIVAAVKEYAGRVDAMIESRNFADYLDAEATLMSKLADVDDENIAYAKTGLELGSILYKMADLLIFGEIDDLSGFMIAMMNNETVGQDFMQYLKMAIGVAFTEGNIDDEDFETIMNEVVSPALDAVKTAGNFSDFDLMQRFYNYRYATNESYSVEEKQKLSDMLVAVDNLIAGKAGVEELVVAWLNGYNYFATKNLQSDYISEQGRITTNIIKTMTALGINVDAFINNLTPAGLTDLLNNTFSDVLNQYVGGDITEFEQKFNEQFTTPFVQMLTDGDELNISQFDLQNTTQLFINFAEAAAGVDVPAALTRVLLTLTDVNNENYIKNAVSFENITDVLMSITQTSNKNELISQVAEMVYYYAAKDGVAQETFTRKCEDLLNDIYDGIDDEDIDVTQTVEDVMEFAETYLREEAKTLVYAVGAIYMIAENPDINYNEVFEFIELPQGVTIDYNAMVQKIRDRHTFENMFSISNIETKLETSQDNLLKEVVEITFSVNCDVEIAAVHGEFVLKFVLQ